MGYGGCGLILVVMVTVAGGTRLISGFGYGGQW